MQPRGKQECQHSYQHPESKPGHHMTRANGENVGRTPTPPLVTHSVMATLYAVTAGPDLLLLAWPPTALGEHAAGTGRRPACGLSVWGSPFQLGTPWRSSCGEASAQVEPGLGHTDVTKRARCLSLDHTHMAGLTHGPVQHRTGVETQRGAVSLWQVSRVLSAAG